METTNALALLTFRLQRFRKQVLDADALLFASPGKRMAVVGSNLCVFVQNTTIPCLVHVVASVPVHFSPHAGVLKNAIDWASRVGPDSPKASPFNDKVCSHALLHWSHFFFQVAGVIGAGGYAATLRSQMAFRQTAVFLNLHVINKPDLVRTPLLCLSTSHTHARADDSRF